MSEREEKVRAGMEMLKKFRESKQQQQASSSSPGSQQEQNKHNPTPPPPSSTTFIPSVPPTSITTTSGTTMGLQNYFQDSGAQDPFFLKAESAEKTIFPESENQNVFKHSNFESGESFVDSYLPQFNVMPSAPPQFPVDETTNYTTTPQFDTTIPQHYTTTPQFEPFQEQVQFQQQQQHHQQQQQQEQEQVQFQQQHQQEERKTPEMQEQLSRLKSKSHEYESQILVQTQQIQALQVALEREQAAKQEGEQAQQEGEQAQQELESHKTSINMLVTEKAELENKLKSLETKCFEKEDVIETLKQELKSHSDRQKSSDDGNRLSQEEMESFRNQSIEDKVNLDSLNHEVRELKQKLGLKEQENKRLDEQLRMTTSKLEMSDVLVTQLRSANITGPEETSFEKDKKIEALEKEKEGSKNREKELTSYIQNMTHDREQIIHQYTSYSKQLTGQIETLMQQLSTKQEENKSLVTREAELTSHVENLENQLQTFIQVQQQQKQTKNNSEKHEVEEDLKKKLVENEEVKHGLETQRQKLEALVREREEEVENVKLQLIERDTAISELETQVEMLNNSSDQASMMNPDLFAAYESDKVAASRAMTQNAKLKEELEELQNAVISLTNDKADLSNELDSLRYQRSHSSENETTTKLEMEALQEAVRERDRIVDQLKEQMKYYVAFAENSINGHQQSDIEEEEQEGEEGKDGEQEDLKQLTKQLQKAKEEIRSLNSQNCELRSQMEVLASSTRDVSISQSREAMLTPSSNMSSSAGSTSGRSEGVSSRLSSHLGDTISYANEQQSSHHHAEKTMTNHQDTINSYGIPILNHNVAFLKLEQKFSEAMNRIAELLNENDQLQRLTVQLQEETETVGEYITMYQYQRQQIKKRMEEKEAQLQAVSREREEMKNKLEELQILLKSYLHTGRKEALKTVGNNNKISDQTEGEETNKVANGKETIFKGDEKAFSKSMEVLLGEEKGQKESVTNSKAAERIMTLLSEIESNQMLHEQFHPWFWEQSQGKLMTV